MLRLPRSLSVAVLAIASALAGCGSSQDLGDPGGNSGTGASSSVPKSIEPSGIYKIEGSPDYAWLKLEASGRYGVWSAGDICNKDPATAPASCLILGTYVINEAQAEILFTDDKTGTAVASPYEVTAFAIPGTTSTQNTGGGSKGGGSGSGSGGSQKPVATAFNLSKCIQAAMVACSLWMGAPEPVPEILRPLPPRAGQVKSG